MPHRTVIFAFYSVVLAMFIALKIWLALEQSTFTQRKHARQSILDRPVQQTDFQRASLRQVADFLQKQTGVPIHFNHSDLESYGIDPEASIDKLSLGGETLERTLDTLSDRLFHTRALSWFEEGGQIELIADDGLPTMNCKWAIYDVRALPGSQAHNQAFSSCFSQFSWPVSEVSRSVVTQLYPSMISTTSPQGFLPPPGATIVACDGWLFIFETDKNHQKISEFLLRRESELRR